jgi:hypothetical protein
MDEAFDTLVGVCGEGAKTNNIDMLDYEIDGKSKTTWKTGGENSLRGSSRISQASTLKYTTLVFCPVIFS